jgi:hypothetical protein
MLTKEISEVEKEIIKEVLFDGHDMRKTRVFPLALRRHLPEIEDLIKKTIDCTLKYCQEKFKKLQEQNEDMENTILEMNERSDD